MCEDKQRLSQSTCFQLLYFIATAYKALKVKGGIELLDEVHVGVVQELVDSEGLLVDGASQ